MNALLLDHLWQSTLFAIVAGLLTLAFRNNRAAVRHWLWFAASMKFLIPFSLLVAFGATVFHPLVPEPQSVYDMQSAAQPFSVAAPALSAAASAPTAFLPPWLDWAVIALIVWALGFAAILAVWLARWSRLNWALRRATALPMDTPMPVKLSASSLEPGLVGIWHPILVLPQGILETLSATQMRSVIAHECCHYRRRDNLTAALHMAVETLFWFHPLVWWIGARLIQERENACDESVIENGGDPETYAESILKVCKLYVHSPLACASGVSGADLKKRIEKIMENEIASHLNAIKKCLLATCAATAIIAPLTLGLLTVPEVTMPALAQAMGTPHPGTEAALRHQIESMEKGQADFDMMVPSLAQAARAQSERSQTNFQKWGALKAISFRGNDNGNDVYLVEFQNQLTAWTIGPLQPDGKVGPMLFFGPAIKRDGDGPSPGLKAVIRQELDGAFEGKPALDVMSPGLQTATQVQWPVIVTDAQSLGAVQTVAFQEVNPRGWDVYHVTFVNGSATVQAAPLVDGKLTGILHSDILLPQQPQHSGTQASLRRYVESLENGQPNYDDMEPVLAATVKQQLPDLLANVKRWGALQSIIFRGRTSQSMDAYDVTFANGRVRWNVGPLDADGKVARRNAHEIS